MSDVKVAIRLQKAPKANPARIEAGNSSGREAKALKKATKADRALMRTRKRQRGVPLECKRRSGTYLHAHVNIAQFCFVFDHKQLAGTAVSVQTSQIGFVYGATQRQTYMLQP